MAKLALLGVSATHDGSVFLYRAGRTYAGSSPFPPHHHDELELNLVRRGQAAYLVKEGRIELPAGTLIWLRPGGSHRLVDVSADYQAWTLNFRRRLVQRVCTSAMLAPLRRRRGANLWRRLSRAQTRRLDGLFGQTAHAPDVAVYNAALAHALAQSFVEFELQTDGPQATAVHPAVHRAVELLANTEETLDLSQLATRCGLSAPHLSRLFKQQVGVALTEFRNRRRVERTLVLLANPETTLTDAAYAAGFGSYVQFHRVFKRQMGYAPSDYRRS